MFSLYRTTYYNSIWMRQRDWNTDWKWKELFFFQLKKINLPLCYFSRKVFRNIAMRFDKGFLLNGTAIVFESAVVEEFIQKGPHAVEELHEYHRSQGSPVSPLVKSVPLLDNMSQSRKTHHKFSLESYELWTPRLNYEQLIKMGGTVWIVATLDSHLIKLEWISKRNNETIMNGKSG